MITCEFETDIGGPHEGCAEFETSPTLLRCPEAATQRGTFHTGHTPGEVSYGHFCDEHKAVVDDDDDPGAEGTTVTWEAIPPPPPKQIAGYRVEQAIANKLVQMNDFELRTLLAQVVESVFHDGGFDYLGSLPQYEMAHFATEASLPTVQGYGPDSRDEIAHCLVAVEHILHYALLPGAPQEDPREIARQAVRLAQGYSSDKRIKR